jgi:hypothetical protein
VPKRNRRRKAKAARPAGRRPSRRPPTASPERDLISDVAAALDEHPLTLLMLASMLTVLLEPSRPGPFEPPAPAPVVSRDELLQTFFDVDRRETSALLVVLGALSGDDVLRRRVHREVAARGDALPGWLADLHRATPVPRTVEVVHVLGDGDNVLVGVRLAGGDEFTAVVYIDHNVGTLVKDAFVVPETLDVLAEQMAAVADDPDTVIRDLDPADARTRIAEAIERGAITYPPFESDTWPECRPLVEWAVAMLPEGGSGYRPPEWTEAQRKKLARRVLASPFAVEMDDSDAAGVLDDLLWFGTDYGPGDPLRWSPVAVEIVLVDWIPRKIVADVEYLERAPEVLRALIRFSHHERGIRPALTAETLAAVDEYELEYQRLIRSARPQGPAALLAALGAPGMDGPWDEPYRDLMLDALLRAVGGEAALDALDTDPLPDEPFSWGDLPADIHDRVGEVLTLIDDCCDTLLDVEYRTACRRLLADAAAGDPAIFRRRGKPETAAGAICWVIGHANTLFGNQTTGSGLLVKDLLGHFGIGQGSVSQRSEPLLRAIGVNPHGRYGAMDLETTRYLVAARRAGILELRDHYRAVDADQ